MTDRFFGRTWFGQASEPSFGQRGRKRIRVSPLTQGNRGGEPDGTVPREPYRRGQPPLPPRLRVKNDETTSVRQHDGPCPRARHRRLRSAAIGLLAPPHPPRAVVIAPPTSAPFIEPTCSMPTTALDARLLGFPFRQCPKCSENLFLIAESLPAEYPLGGPETVKRAPHRPAWLT